jgi:hypothetical protein
VAGSVEIRLKSVDGVDVSDATVSRLVYAINCTVPGRKANEVGQVVHRHEQLVQTGGDGAAQIPEMPLDAKIVKACRLEETRALIQVFRGVDRRNDLWCDVFSGTLSEAGSNMVIKCRRL